jgi:hypothetical protein
LLQCAAVLDIDYNPIQDCAEGAQGDQLLAAMGNRTLYFTPQITFVPTVAVNGVSTFIRSHQITS